MFRDIHFYKQSFSIPLTNKNLKYTSQLYFGDYYRQFPDAEDEIEEGFNFSGSEEDFLLDGSILSCIQYPVSYFARKNLFYIHGFCIMDSGKQSFTKRKNMNSCLLSVTYEGEGRLEYNGQTHHLKPGLCFLIDCTKPYFYKTEGTHWKHAELHFSGSFCDFIVNEIICNNIVFPWSADGSLQKQLEDIIYSYDNILPYRDFILSNQIESLLLSLLKHSDTYYKQRDNIPENLKYLLRYIDLHYNEHLTLDFLSEFSNLNKYHLSRLFKKYLGYPPKEYILQIQLKNAIDLLKTTDLPVNKIGAIIGMENENHFSHFIKSRTGMSPGILRKNPS